MARERANLDLPDVSGFKPREPKAIPESNREELEEAAATAGFRTKHAPPSPAKKPKTFDARSLRKSNKTAKLNIALSDENRERFWLIAQKLDLTGGEEALVAMMDAIEHQMDDER